GGPVGEGVAVWLDALQLGEAAEVDEVRGTRQPQLHHRDQALAAGEHAAVVAVSSKQRSRLSDGLGAVIGEGSRDHGASPPADVFDAFSDALRLAAGLGAA